LFSANFRIIIKQIYLKAETSVSNPSAGPEIPAVAGSDPMSMDPETMVVILNLGRISGLAYLSYINLTG